MLNYSFKLLILLFSFYCFIPSFLWSQSIYFNKIYDSIAGNYFNEGLDVLELPGEGYIFTAFSAPWDYYKKAQYVIAKTDYNGNILWQKAYGDSNWFYYISYPGSLINTQDGNYAFTGSVASTAAPKGDALLIKFDSNGDTLWTKRYGGDSLDAGNYLIETKDKGFLICGLTYSYGDIYEGDAYLVKTDSMGNLQWQNTYGKGLPDLGYTVDDTKDGGYIVGGYTESDGGGIYLLKVDSAGTQQWYKVIGTGDVDAGGFVFESQDGNYIVNGLIRNNLDNMSNQVYIVKINALTKGIIWESTFGGSENDIFWHLIELDNGDFLGAGSHRDSAYNARGWVMKISADGDSIWSRKFNDTLYDETLFYSLDITSDNGIIAIGSGYDEPHGIWLVKMDSLGYTCSSYMNCDSIVNSIPETSKVYTSLSSPSMNIFPNPLYNNMFLSFSLINAGYVTITIINLIGQDVAILVNNEHHSIGSYKKQFDVSNIQQGIYFLTIQAGSYTGTRKIVILKQKK